MRKRWRLPRVEQPRMYKGKPVDELATKVGVDALEQRVALAIGRVISRGEVAPRGGWLKAAQVAIQLVRESR